MTCIAGVAPPTDAESATEHGKQICATLSTRGRRGNRQGGENGLNQARAKTHLHQAVARDWADELEPVLLERLKAPSVLGVSPKATSLAMAPECKPESAPETQSPHSHRTVTAQSQHSHSTVTAQSQHSHSTVTAQSRHSHRG